MNTIGATKQVALRDGTSAVARETLIAGDRNHMRNRWCTGIPRPVRKGWDYGCDGWVDDCDDCEGAEDGVEESVALDVVVANVRGGGAGSLVVICAGTGEAVGTPAGRETVVRGG